MAPRRAREDRAGDDSAETQQQADDALVDAVILAAEREHHEIAVYDGLITHAGALGHERGRRR